MRDVIAAAVGVLRRQVRPVLVVVIAIQVPAYLLVQIPSLGPLSFLGTAALYLGDLAIIGLLTADLRGQPRSTVTPWRILRACGRLLLAYLIGLMLLILVGVIVYVPIAIVGEATGLAARVQQAGAGFAVFYLFIAALAVAASPFLLVQVLCLTEAGGPLWLLKRAWALSRPRRPQIWALIGGLWVMSFLGGNVRQFGWPVGIPAAVAVGLAADLAVSALLAVFYVRLAAEVPVVDGPPRASASFGVMRTLGQAPSPQPQAPLATKRVYRRRP
jgi:hypothetical protein